MYLAKNSHGAIKATADKLGPVRRGLYVLAALGVGFLTVMAASIATKVTLGFEPRMGAVVLSALMIWPLSVLAAKAITGRR